MKRRSLILSIVCALLLFGTLGGTLYGLVRHEKSWYAAAAVPPGDERARLSQEFYTEFFDWFSTFQGEKDWYIQFTQEQVNSYLEEACLQSGLGERLLPDGITEPRIAITQDRMRIGFRYGSGAGSTIISLDVRIWLPPGESSTVALELVGLYAGALPIKAQSLLERMAQIGRDSGIDVTWYRYNGNPVALLRFQAENQRPVLQLQRIELKAGSIMVRGSKPD